MNDALAAAALVASSGLAAPLRGGDESTTWLGSEEHSLNGKLPKTRKPYTITKQRERWSEEEHLRFVEALRLHGRAWRKIEEHIGTKTAVQIRSHAQKFFNKIEKKKEAGETVEKEEDLNIPPPRPKRKPVKPYPRKDGVSISGGTGTSQLQSPSDLQTAHQQQQLLGAYSSTPSETAAAQHFSGLMNGFAANAGPSTVSDATVAAVTAAASAAAAAAAAAVVAAAGQEVQTHMQAHPPSCFPFFGMPPSALSQITPTHGVSALDQAALLGPQAAARATAYDRFAGFADQLGAAPAAPAISTDPMDTGMGDGNGNDRGLVEATGTTDGTHISAGAQLRGSDGDSACSRETDNQTEEQGQGLDSSWRSTLLQGLQQQQQHNASNAGPSAAAAAAQAGGFDLSQLPWGLGGPAFEAAAATLQGATPAQALALLSNPFYQAGLAAADRSGQFTALQAAAAAAVAAAGNAGSQPAGGGVNGSGGLDAMMLDRTKSRRTAFSGNSGSTGPPAGTKRLFAVGSEECLLPLKKVARETSDTGEDADGMEVTPSSPSIQEKEINKAVSQPSNTNGNTSGSNESEGSKRRQGTAQAEGSNPTNGNSSGNGCSVKDSNTGTNTGNGNGNGNGTSAFHPVGHHHHSHNRQQPASVAAHRANNFSTNQLQLGGSSRNQQHHYSSHPFHTNGGEASNGLNGASGTGFANPRDEGRSSSDMEGPAPQQMHSQKQRLQLKGETEADDELMVPVAGNDALQEQQQDNEQAVALQALLASLHGMCGNPLMLQQAYGAAAAAANTPQVVASAMHGSQQQQQRYSQGVHSAAAQQQIAALLQQTRQHSSVQTAPTPQGQGFAPWHGSGSEFASSGSYVGSSLLQQLGNSPAAQQLQAAAGLVGLSGGWPAGDNSSSAASHLLSTYAQIAAAARQSPHQNINYHSSQQQHQASAAAAAAAVSLQQLQQGFRHSSSSNPVGGLAGFAGFTGLSGLDMLTRAASASNLDAEVGAGAAGGAVRRRLQSQQGYSVQEMLSGKRQSRTL